MYTTEMTFAMKKKKIRRTIFLKNKNTELNIELVLNMSL